MNTLQKSTPNRGAGKSCQGFGVHLLRVIYLNRIGWFCNSCRDILASAGLAVDSQTSELKPESSKVTIVTDLNGGEKKKDEKNQENSLH